MKTPSALLILAAFVVIAVQSQAASYSFTATVNRMFEHNHATGVNMNVLSSDLSGFSFANGQMITGSFSYEPATLSSPYDADGASDGYLVFNAGRNFNMQAPSSGFEYLGGVGPASNVVLSESSTHPYGWDCFSQFSNQFDSNGDFWSMQLSLFDHTGTAFSSYSLPANLAFDDFQFRELHLAFLRRSTGDQMHFYARLNSLDPVAVPERSNTSGLLAMPAIILAGCYTLRRRR